MTADDQALRRSKEMLDIVMNGIADDAAGDRLVAQTLADLDAHFTPGLTRYRKSVTEAGDFAAIEWTGDGWLVRDAKGREWIDCLGGYGIYSLGIRHPEVVAAVRAQLDRNPMPTQELLDPFKAMLCALLAQISPGDITNVFVANSGTESVEGAMKIARVFTGRPGFVVADAAFHGKTLGALSLMGKPALRESVEPLLGPVWRVPFGDAAAVGAVLGEHASQIAAVAGRADIWKALEPNPFLHTSTFGGNPLACAAAIASIHVILRDRLWDRAEQSGKRFMDGLETMAQRHPNVLLGSRGKGLLIGMMFPDHQTGYKVASGLFRRGVLVAGTQVSATTIRIEPALTIPDELVDDVISRLDETLTEIDG